MSMAPQRVHLVNEKKSPCGKRFLLAQPCEQVKIVAETAFSARNCFSTPDAIAKSRQCQRQHLREKRPFAAFPFRLEYAGAKSWWWVEVGQI
jgi:hypothetical protein